MIPVAHRGFWWPDRIAQNQLAAITAAVKAGYGLELDARMLELNGEQCIVFQHEHGDTPFLITGVNDGWELVLEALRSAPIILWDIKEPQVVRPLMDWLTRHQLLQNAALFDLELAAPNWGWRELVPSIHPAAPYLRRASEQESLYDALLDAQASGVWLDAWDTEWVDAATIDLVHEAGKTAYVCSSELHQRAIRPALWRRWAQADGICTDFPHLLHDLEINARTELQPTGWHAAQHA